ncbi:MAG TPA: AAA family ATPase, partial [Synergistaceae bacterium]|nr:AAA family ATPase [Synergistaceae bacterium]
TSGFGTHRNRPLGSFLLAGPTGTGKTELAKALAETFFGSEENLLRLDMSEYAESSGINRLIGSSPGFVDSERGGMLTEKIRQNPFTLVLADEIEKASPSVIQLFLQILDEGTLSDASGETFDFRNALIICTSNAVGHSRKRSLGFASEQEAQKAREDLLKEELQQTFSREFLGRFDDSIFFEDLSQETLQELFALLLRKEQEILTSRGITLDVEEEALELLARRATGSPSGGRKVHGLLESEILTPLSELLVAGEKNIRIFLSSEAPGKVLLEPFLHE